MPLPYEQQPGESSRAFRAFAFYRELGPERSIDRAYTEYLGGAKPGRAPGQWNAWSRERAWVERASAYDAHVDQEKRKARERKIRELEDRRFDFELKNQAALERRVERMDELLDKAEATPVTDVVQVKEEESLQHATKTTTKTVVRALKLSGYARTVQERNDTAKQAIVGVRIEKKTELPAAQPTGIVYRPADDTPVQA